ncbi:MAG TPA: glycine cleavage system protein GcvH [Actinomycetota bacterium]|nr:glycine cleavage system protein GcvH [Actinomycetota bacterium]
MYPEDLRYTKEHEWARLEGGNVRVGITHYAQDALGDIVYVDLPGPGTEVSAGQPFGEVESTKSVSDIYSPLTGTIAERNARLEESPDLVNQDPYGDGWMVVIEATNVSELDGLLTSAQYQGFIASEQASS